MKAALVVAMVGVSIGLAGQGQPSPQASGTFVGRKWMFEAAGAYAFPAMVGTAGEPGILVAVASAGLLASRLDLYYDRRHALETFKDDEVSVVYFHFTPTGAYKGMNYYLGGGDGCGFCYDGSVRSDVRVAGGRIRGSLRLSAPPDDVSFDLRFDVPVAPRDYGQPLPGGGGEPGAVYARLHSALEGNDANALTAILTNETRAEMAADGPAILDGFRENHPTGGYRIVDGWSRGDRALLLVEGETPYAKVRTEALFVREDGTWRIDTEVLQIRIDTLP
jgi:hypothetical protein